VSEVLLVESHGAVRLLTMHRPEKLNALNHELTTALVRELERSGTDPPVGAIVLSGSGRAFCAGADTSEFSALTQDDPSLVRERAALTTRLHLMFSRLAVPVVAAVNGYALGGGCGLALAADVAIAGESASFGLPEITRGIVPAVVMANVVRHAGRKRAFELVALGERIDAARALDLGLVTRVVPDAHLMETALEIAQRLATLDRAAMAATKRLFYRVADLTLEQGLDAGQDANVIMRSFGGRER
jgi:enoyl-CoA hydratase/carnithine racemase